jgi:hypothetical protein
VAELAAHAWHDPMRVAASLDRGAPVASLLDLCARCGALYADLVLLAAALPLAAVPARSRDFRLTAVEARRLRSGRWRSWWAIIGSARDSLTRPLAIGFTTLGLAGLLVTTAPAFLPMVGSLAGASSGAAAPLDREMLAPAASDPVVMMLGSDPTTPPQEVSATDVAGDPVATVTISAGLFALGIGLFAVRRMAALGRRVR